MRKLSGIACCILILIFAAKDAFSTEDVQRVYLGKLDKKIGFQMEINRKGNDIEGSYFYTKYKKRIPVKGSFDESGNFAIDEMNEKGEKTALFTGSILKPGVFIGMWSNLKDKKVLIFKMEEIANNLPEGRGVSGHYTRGEDYIDVLLLKPGTIKFQGAAAWLGAQPGVIHTGEISGTTTISGKNATYAAGKDESSCKVEMKFEKDKLVAKDNNHCGGLNVTFTGDFTRKGDTVPGWEIYNLDR